MESWPHHHRVPLELLLFERKTYGDGAPYCLEIRIRPSKFSKYPAHIQGLDDLDKRCEQYFQAGARFAKWRGVLHMNPTPSPLAIEANMEALARYAATCQSKGLVPVVEPEILMSGSHSIFAAAKATEEVLVALFAKLMQHNVLLEGCLLKPNMVRSGESSKDLAPMAQVAALTLRCSLFNTRHSCFL